MIYEFTVVAAKPGTQAKAVEAIGNWFGGASLQGSMVGCWYTDVGALNRVSLLMAYESGDLLIEDKSRVVRSENPYGVIEFSDGIESNTFSPFPFVGDLLPGDPGPWYEIRTYDVFEGRLQPTIDGWAEYYERRNAISPLLFAGYAVSGKMPRMVHIWPYGSLDQRVALRRQANQTGAWPAPPGAVVLRAMQSELYLAAAFSPLR
jgi:hypothetical protein